MKVTVEQIIRNPEYDKLLSIIIPTPSVSAEIYRRSRASVVDSVKNSKIPYSVSLVSVESSEDDFRFSKSVNAGVSELNANLYLNMNDDLILNTSSLRNAIEYMTSFKGVGLLGANLYYPDGSVQHAGVESSLSGSFKYFNRMIFYYRAPLDAFRKISTHRKVGLSPFVLFTNFHSTRVRIKGLAVGAFHLTSESAMKDAGGYDENFKMGMEDLDFCLTVIKKGYRVRIPADVKVIHYEGFHGVDYSKLFGKETEKYFYSKWSAEEIINLVEANGFLSGDVG